MNKSAHDSSTGFPDDILLTLAGCKYPEISAFHIHSNYYVGVLAWWSGGLQYCTAALYYAGALIQMYILLSCESPMSKEQQ